MKYKVWNCDDSLGDDCRKYFETLKEAEAYKEELNENITEMFEEGGCFYGEDKDEEGNVIIPFIRREDAVKIEEVDDDDIY